MRVAEFLAPEKALSAKSAKVPQRAQSKLGPAARLLGESLLFVLFLASTL
jgi:hypothetical protein